MRMKYYIVQKEDELSKKIKSLLMEKIQLEYSHQQPDYVIVIGGDGTLLAAVHQFPNAILFAIHTGHLGFYANYTLEDLDCLVEDIHHGSFIVEKLDIIQGKIETSKGSIEDFAINEMTILCPLKPLILEVKIDGIRLETFRGTGICISTSYGSTAYNKSLSGAVIDPKLKAFQLTEIAGMNSNQYRTLSSSLLLSTDRRVELEAKEHRGLVITFDQISYSLQDFNRASLLLKASQISLAHHNEKSFIDRIRRAFLKD